MKGNYQMAMLICRIVIAGISLAIILLHKYVHGHQFSAGNSVQMLSMDMPYMLAKDLIVAGISVITDILFAESNEKFLKKAC